MLFSIVFLILMLGIPVAMVAAVIVLVRNRNNAVKGIIDLAQSKGWRFVKSDGEHLLYTILQNRVFSIRKGSHTLTNIIEPGPDSFICDYHYVSPGTSKHRRSITNTMAIVKRKTEGPDFRIVRRHDGPMGKLAETLAMGDFHPVSGDKWSWALTSSVESFEKTGWVDPVPGVLEKRMVPGGSLFLTGDYLVLSKPGVLDRDRVLQLKEDMDMIRDLV